MELIVINVTITAQHAQEEVLVLIAKHVKIVMQLSQVPQVLVYVLLHILIMEHQRQ